MNATRTHETGPGPASLEGYSPISVEQVYHDFAPRVYNLARRMVKSEADAEDVTQDVLLQVVRKLPGFRGEAALPTWLHRITVNAALTHRRKKAVREEHREKSPLDVLLADAPPRAERRAGTPEDRLMRREFRRLVDRAVAGLPPAYRAVFELADLEGLPNAAVAARLGMSLAAVKSRLHRARQMLRERLAPHVEGAAASRTPPVA